MALDKSYLEYPLRRHGMDHELYPWSNMFERKPITWPGKARIALWISVSLEFFPLNVKAEPFKAPGAMVTPYPDYRTYSTKDYGNRVGIYRIMKVLDKYKIKASAPTNAAIAERYPALIKDMVNRNWEIVGHGLDMNHLHYGGLEESAEREQIKSSLETLRSISGQAVTGWFSPARSESENTLHLLPEYGIDYCCDWINDDLPYEIATKAGPLIALPHSNEIDDNTILNNNRGTEAVFIEQLKDAFDLLYAEAEKYGGRIMPITLHPYVIGQPWRIKALEDVLAYIMEKPGVWAATGQEIAAAWREQQ